MRVLQVSGKWSRLLLLAFLVRSSWMASNVRSKGIVLIFVLPACPVTALTGATVAVLFFPH